MGGYIDPVKKEKAYELRIEGKSYNEIRKILNLKSKGTLSYWFKDFRLTLVAKKRLADKIKFAQDRGLLRFNKERTKKILAENKKIRSAAAGKISKLEQREAFLVAVALYWGEGSQGENSRFQSIEFSNSNPVMMKFFIKFLREVMKISEEKIKFTVNIYPGYNETEVIKFWSKTLRFPESRIRITNYISGASKLKRPKRFLPHGTAAIRVNSRKLFFEMKGYIDGLMAQIN